jgi:hypothetical protein
MSNQGDFMQPSFQNLSRRLHYGSDSRKHATYPSQMNCCTGKLNCLADSSMCLRVLFTLMAGLACS